MSSDAMIRNYGTMPVMLGQQIRKVKKEGLNKDRKFFCCPNDKETSCRYFEWIPKEENHMFYQSVSFPKQSLEKSPSEKTGEHYLTEEFINDFANSLNI